MDVLARVRFEGHLRGPDVIEQLGKVASRGQRVSVVVDCRAMTGYDLDARNEFVAWHGANAARIAGVAIVTANPLYRMVIRAMSLAAGVDMRAFAEPSDAERWAAERVAASRVA